MKSVWITSSLLTTFNTESDSRSQEDKSQKWIVFTNKNILPSNIQNLRVIHSSNTRTNHNLLLDKIFYNICRIKYKPSENYNIKSFVGEITRNLYKNWLTENISYNNVQEQTDIEVSLDTLRVTIMLKRKKASITKI